MTSDLPRDPAAHQHPFPRLLVRFLWIFGGLILAGTLILVVFGSITNYDSLTTHMARVKYYQQFGKIGYFGANHWAQDTHPFVLPALHLLLLKCTHWENSAVLVQWFSLVLSAWFTGKFAFALTQNRRLAQASGLLLFLFVNPVVQAATTQNDLVLTALVSVQLWLAASGRTLRSKLSWIWFLILVGVGVKQTFVLFQLPVAVVLFWKEGIRWTHWRQSIPWIRLLVISVLAGPVFLYHFIENYRHLGNVNGFKEVVESHSFAGKSLTFILKGGTRNLVRYAFDFLTLDGLNTYPALKPYFLKANNFFKWILLTVTQPLTGHLERGPEVRVGFFYLKPFSIEDSSSFWGPIGPLLILPALVQASWQGLRHRAWGVAQMLVVCLVLFVLLQAYSSYYDMWRGRYFNEAIPFSAVLATLFIHRFWPSRWFRFFLAGGIFLSAMATFGTTYLRYDKTIVWAQKPTWVWTASREDLMTRRNADYLHIISFIGQLPDEVDSLGLYTTENMPEYILFDVEGRRKLFPMHTFKRPSPWRHLQPDALLFTENVFPPMTGDTLLGAFGVNGERLYFRRLR